MFPRSLFLMVLLVVCSSVARSGVMDDLSAADAGRVRGGGQVVVAKDVVGKPWPLVTVYQKVDASPEETMAVFFDYNNAVDYVPNCLKSEITQRIDARTFDVDYTVDVPILSDEEYTVRNQLSDEGNGGLKVEWRVLRATSIKSSEGSLVVEPLGSGSVLRYQNIVEPSSIAAPLLKGVAVGQMSEMVEALVERVDSRGAAGLAEPVRLMRSALGR